MTRPITMFFELPSLTTILSTIGLVAISVCVTLLILKRQDMLAFLKNLKALLPQSGNTSADDLKGGAWAGQRLNVSFEGERILLDELSKLNDKVGRLNGLLTQHRTESQRERSALLQAINVFKSEQQEVQRSTWAAAAQLFQQQLNTLNDIASNTNLASMGSPKDVLPAHTQDSSYSLPSAAVPQQPAKHPSTPSQPLSSPEMLNLRQPASGQAEQLENFITSNLERINQAAHHGVDGVKTLVAGAGIEVYSPSDVVFILAERGIKADLAGKAFALPGQLLGRPWVEWFEASKEWVYPVESTLYPATVFHKEDGNWEIRKKGRVSLQ